MKILVYPTLTKSEAVSSVSVSQSGFGGSNLRSLEQKPIIWQYFLSLNRVFFTNNTKLTISYSIDNDGFQKKIVKDKVTCGVGGGGKSNVNSLILYLLS